MGIDDNDKLPIEEFFEAISGQDGRYELMDGVAYAMAGAKQGHNVILSNIQAVMVPAGKKAGCRTTSSYTAVQTGPETVRYPDVVVDCGPPNANSLVASEPTTLVEVSSPGTAVFDYGAKLREYQALASVLLVLQVESEFALVKVHTKGEDGTWSQETIEEFDVPMPIPRLDTSITLEQIYDTVDLRLPAASSRQELSENV